MTSGVAVIWAPYCGPGPGPAEWLGRWNLDPVLIAALAIGLGLVVWRTSGARRAGGVAAILNLAVIVVSPLGANTPLMLKVSVPVPKSMAPPTLVKAPRL